MPAGATVAGDLFQRKLDEYFGKLKQVIIIADDILVVRYKADHSDHDQAFTSLLQTAQKCNVKLNFDKLQYKQNEVDFFGETFTTGSLKPARSKVSAIIAMPSPTSMNQVQLLIGMISYLSTFLPRLSKVAEPVRELSKGRERFNWGPEYQIAFGQMKEEISCTPMLAYYNPNKKTVLQTDTSIKGLGACLLQEEKAVILQAKLLKRPRKICGHRDRIACN